MKSPTSSLQSSKKLLFKNSDIIFENDLVQVGVKVEAKKSVLHIEFYYGNKTNFSLTNLSTAVTLPDQFDPGRNVCLAWDRSANARLS